MLVQQLSSIPTSYPNHPESQERNRIPRLRRGARRDLHGVRPFLEDRSRNEVPSASVCGRQVTRRADEGAQWLEWARRRLGGSLRSTLAAPPSERDALACGFCGWCGSAAEATGRLRVPLTLRAGAERLSAHCSVLQSEGSLIRFAARATFCCKPTRGRLSAAGPQNHKVRRAPLGRDKA